MSASPQCPFSKSGAFRNSGVGPIPEKPSRQLLKLASALKAAFVAATRAPLQEMTAMVFVKALFLKVWSLLKLPGLWLAVVGFLKVG